ITIVETAMAKGPIERYADAGKMYEALLAFLYAQGRRYGAHDLAEFLVRFREPEPAHIPAPMLEGEPHDRGTNERTPVEIPEKPGQSGPPRTDSVPYVDIERAAEMGERREVTSLVIELPAREDAQLGNKAQEIVTRYGGRVMKREPEQIAALFGLGEPD